MSKPKRRNGRERINVFMSVGKWVKRDNHELAQQVKPLARQPGHLSLIPENPHKGGRRESSLPSCLLNSAVAHAPPHTNNK